jgi:protease secretion system membrane fusion protein
MAEQQKNLPDKQEKVDSWLESWNPYHPTKSKETDAEPVNLEESVVRVRFFRIFFIAFTVFMAWAYFAPIDSGVPAQGSVVVAGYRKAVQTMAGGVIGDIRIKEGDEVKKGDVLFTLNPLNSEANVSSVRLEYLNALVSEARLVAERLGQPIRWPAMIDSLGSQYEIQEAKQIQQQLYNARRDELVKTVDSKRKQLVTLSEEYQNLEQLAQEGYVPRAQAAQALRSKIETESYISNFESNYHKQVETELADVQKRRDALRDKYQAVAFELKNSTVRAPDDGVIVGLKVNTVGGVITPGQLLAEVVPNHGKLVADVKLPATAISKVKVGLEVDMRFEAFNAVTTPTVPGKVLMVGADMVLPDKTKPGEPDYEYYRCQVETTDEGLKMLGDLSIRPGMPVTVVIKTGERNFISLLLKPITDRLAVAFK